MIKFFVRLIILLISLALTIGFAAGIDINAFLLAVIFLCVWVIVVPFEDIFWWLFTYSIIFSILSYDYFGVYIIILLGVALAFDFIYGLLKRSANDGNFVLFGIMFLLAGASSIILSLVKYGSISFNPSSIILDILITTCIFFIFKFVIQKLERFINLYTHGTDMRCHT
ncbi:MAG: hypothetical protein ACKUBY_03090 [Candidatus Moraniibacteriota bacterium]|jgi:hypothetical protein